MRLLFELSGEHATLPTSEVLASVEAEGFGYEIIERGDRILVLETDASPERLGERIALAHNVGEFVASGAVSELEDASEGLELIGTIAVRLRDLRPKSKRNEGADPLERIRSILTKGRKVDLRNPENEIRVILGERCYLTRKMFKIDRPSFEQRKVEHRPFFSPISLHPKYARAMVNLSRTATGKSFLDPFCGTGGILIEAGMIGANIIGGDIKEDMVQGCSENLGRFGISSRMLQLDVGDVKKEVSSVHSIATDPPYGRSSSTMREDPGSLYERAFGALAEILEEHSYLAIVLPGEEFIDIGKDHLDLVEVHRQRVHRSLERFYCVFRNP